jgi:hypothetical protein
MEEGVIMEEKRIRLNIKRFASSGGDEPTPTVRYSQSPRVEINSDLKIKGTNRDLKDVDTSLTNILTRLNDQVYFSGIMASTAQSFTSGTYALVNIGNVETDTHNGFNVSTHAYTIPRSGYYIINTQVEFNFDGTRRIVSRIHVNGTAIRYGIAGGVGFSSAVTLNEIRYLTQGDVITLQAKVDGVASTIGASNMSTFMQIKSI